MLLGRRTSRTTYVLTSAAVACVATSIAHAADSTWLLATGGSWTDPSRWSSNPYYPNNGQPTPDATYDASIAVSGSPYIVMLSGTQVTVNSLTLSSPNATLRLPSGTLQATNGLFVTGGLFQVLGGTISNTTISGSGGLVQVDGGLDAVTLQHDVEFDIATVTNGLTLSGGTPFVPNDGKVAFSGTQTLGGNGTFTTFGAPTAQFLVTNGGTLTIGPNVTILGGGELNYYNGGIINLGTIRAQSQAIMEVLPGNPSGQTGY